MALFFSYLNYTDSNYGANDGTISNITVTGGTGTVTVTIKDSSNAIIYSGNVPPLIANQINLPPDTYSLSAVDQGGDVSVPYLVVIAEKPETILTANISDACDCEDCDCVVTVSNYVHNSNCFTYSLYDGAILVDTYSGCAGQEYHQFTGLCTGNYRIEAIELDGILYTHLAGSPITESVLDEPQAINELIFTEPCSLCYRATNCADASDTILITLPANLPALDTSVTYTFVEFPDKCWTVEPSDECGGVPGSEILINTGFIDAADNLGVEDQADFNWQLTVGDVPVPTPAIITNQSFPGYGSLFNALWINQIVAPHQIGHQGWSEYETTFVLPVGFIPSLIFDLLTDVRAVVTLNGFIIGDNSNPVTYPNPLGTSATFSTANPIHFNANPAINTINVTVATQQEQSGFALSGIITSVGTPLESTPVTIDEIFVDCADCLGICYELIDCEGLLTPIQTSTDLSSYVGQTITLLTCPDTCWSVFELTECPITVIDVLINAAYTDCISCLPSPAPEPPLVIKNRTVKPGYNTKGCSPEYVEKINCDWSEAMFQKAASVRYGIEFCCLQDLDDLDIKKQLMDFKMITDPEACVTTSSLCCPPCNVTAELIVFYPVTCPAPRNVSAILIPPPVVLGKDCRLIRFSASGEDSAVPLTFIGTACNGSELIVTIFLGQADVTVCVDINQSFVKNPLLISTVLNVCS